MQEDSTPYSSPALLRVRPVVRVKRAARGAFARLSWAPNCCYCCSVIKSCPTLWPYRLQHARPPCSSPSLGVCPSSRPLWIGDTIQPSHPLLPSSPEYSSSNTCTISPSSLRPHANTPACPLPVASCHSHSPPFTSFFFKTPPSPAQHHLFILFLLHRSEIP